VGNTLRTYGSFDRIFPLVAAEAVMYVAAQRGEPVPEFVETLRSSLGDNEDRPNLDMVNEWLSSHDTPETRGSYIGEGVSLAADNASRGAEFATSDPLIRVISAASRIGLERDSAPQPGRILDVACGSGRLLQRLVSELGAVSAVGQERNATMAALAKADFFIRGVDADIQVANSLTTDAFPDEHFELVVADIWERSRPFVVVCFT
jgi:type I restriction-modification system DNA methylase subunit